MSDSQIKSDHSSSAVAIAHALRHWGHDCNRCGYGVIKCGGCGQELNGFGHRDGSGLAENIRLSLSAAGWLVVSVEDVEEARAERDRLRAENERLKEEGDAFTVTGDELDRALDRAEKAEAENEHLRAGISWVRGMCSDEEPHAEIDYMLGEILAGSPRPIDDNQAEGTK
jgi:hypothetical protein